MLVIKTIKLSGTSSLKIRKLTKVRVGYGQYICSNKKPAKLIQQQVIEWKQDMSLPIILKKTLQFQFYPKHQFGYNPQQISLTCYAKATIQNFKRNNLQADVLNSKGETVGLLYFEYDLFNLQKKKLENETACKISVSSILAHLDNYYGQRGYFQISIMNQSSMTPQIRLVAGQFFWTQKLTVPVQSSISEKQQLCIRVFVDDILIGQADIQVKNIKNGIERYKKLPILRKETKQKCGMIFVDVYYSEKKITKQKIQDTKSNKNYKSSSILPMLHTNKVANRNQNINLKSSYSQSRLQTNINTANSQSSRISKPVNQNASTKNTINQLFLYKLGEYNKNIKAQSKYNFK